MGAAILLLPFLSIPLKNFHVTPLSNRKKWKTEMEFSKSSKVIVIG